LFILLSWWLNLVAGIIIALLIGIIAGVIQFFLLFKFVVTVTGGKGGVRTLLFGLTQFIFPFAVLIICAFLIGDYLMWVGIGIASALIIGAVIRFVFASKQPAKTDKK